MTTTDTTWAERLNSALDELSRLYKARADALDAATLFLREHPEHDTDRHITTLRLALL